MISEESETALIGLALSGRTVADVKPEDFGSGMRGEIWRAIMELYQAGDPTDPLAVIGLLERSGTLQSIGGALQIQQYQESSESVVMVEYHAERVRNLSVARKLLKSWEESCEELKASGEALAASDGLIKSTLELTSSCVKVRAATTDEMTDEAHGILKELYEGKLTLGTPTGFSYLDAITLGWQKSMTYCVTASKPGVGKSAFVMQSLLTAQTRGPCLYVSGEMKRFMVWLRDVSARAKQHVNKIRNGRFGENERGPFADAIQKYREEKIHTLDQRAPTYPQIAREIIRIQNQDGPLSLVVVDMVQHIGAEGKTEWDKIDNAVKHMTDIAERFSVPLVYVSRANRKETNEGIPTLATPYGSSRIESDASAVFALCHADDYLKPKAAKFSTKAGNKIVTPEPSQIWNKLGWSEPEENAVVLMTLKNRFGPMLDIPLNYEGQFFTFSQVDNLKDAAADAEARNTRYRSGNE